MLKSIKEYKFVLRDWISLGDLDMKNLSLNVNSIDFFIENIHLVDWLWVSKNSNCGKLLEKFPEMIDWSDTNPVTILVRKPKKIPWKLFISNKSCFRLLSEKKGIEFYSIHKKEINKSSRYSNSNPESIISPNMSPTNSFNLSPSETSFVNRCIEKRNWINLCSSDNPYILSILEKNLDNVSWYELSSNPTAISLLEKHKNKICWKRISLNSSIFIDQPFSYKLSTMNQVHQLH
jgi:hypothetical protein